MIQANYFWFQPNGNSKSTHVYITLKNLDSRTIKYCTFAFTGYNAVGDVVNWKNDKRNAILQIVGPVATGICVESTFESVWCSTVKISDMKLMIVNIEYMDGTTEVIPGQMVNPIPKTESTAEQKNTEGCYIATCVYGSYDCPQVWTLRHYRDNTLAKTWYGRTFIKTYYAISPTIVKWFGETKWFKNVWRKKLDRIIEKLESDEK